MLRVLATLFMLWGFSTFAYAQNRNFYRPPGGGTLIILGTDFQTCSLLNSANVEVRRQAYHWWTGYFSGAFVYGSFGSDPAIKAKMNDLDPVKTWQDIKEYCKSHPGEQFVAAVQIVLNRAIFNK